MILAHKRTGRDEQLDPGCLPVKLHILPAAVGDVVMLDPRMGDGVRSNASGSAVVNPVAAHDGVSQVPIPAMRLDGYLKQFPVRIQAS